MRHGPGAEQQQVASSSPSLAFEEDLNIVFEPPRALFELGRGENKLNKQTQTPVLVSVPSSTLLTSRSARWQRMWLFAASTHRMGFGQHYQLCPYREILVHCQKAQNLGHSRKGISGVRSLCPSPMFYVHMAAGVQVWGCFWEGLGTSNSHFLALLVTLQASCEIFCKK